MNSPMCSRNVFLPRRKFINNAASVTHNAMQWVAAVYNNKNAHF